MFRLCFFNFLEVIFKRASDYNFNLSSGTLISSTKVLTNASCAMRYIFYRPLPNYIYLIFTSFEINNLEYCDTLVVNRCGDVDGRVV